MAVIEIDLNKLYKAWRKYMLEHSDAAHFGMINDKTVAEFPYSNMAMLGRPTDAATLTNEECTVDLTVQTDNYIDNPQKILSLHGMDDACWAFFQMLGFKRMGDSTPTPVSNSNVTRITSRFTMRNFPGYFLVDLDDLLAE